MRLRNIRMRNERLRNVQCNVRLNNVRLNNLRLSNVRLSNVRLAQYAPAHCTPAQLYLRCFKGRRCGGGSGGRGGLNISSLSYGRLHQSYFILVNSKI